MGTIAVKNVDERLYRRIKALASLEGRSVGEEVNDALAMWLSRQTSSPELLELWEKLEEQSEVNNRAYDRMHGRFLTEHRGEYAVVSSGKLVGVFKREQEAYLEASKSHGRQTIVAHIEERKKQPRTIELGWSLLGGVGVEQY